MVSKTLLKEMSDLPDKPGVYLFKDTDGLVLYVGKAKSLKKRVRSYANKKQPLPKIKHLVAGSARLDFYVTATEVEALVLEVNLIKQNRPRYNVSFRDDKSYPYLAVSFGEDWPRVRYTRERHRSNSRYFGPYTNARALRETLDTLLKIFPLRTCSDSIFTRAQNTGQACLYHHINRCPGPCVGLADPKNYARTLKRFCAFLDGRQEQVITDLGRDMAAAADRMEYERAGVFRDRIKTATQILEKQKVATDTRLNQDVFGLAVEENIGCVQMLRVRAGKLIGSEDFIIDQTGGIRAKDVMTGFIKQYYDDRELIPDEVVLPGQLDGSAAIADWLGTKRGKRVKLIVPSRGLKKRLTQMAFENAGHSLARFKIRSDHESKTIMEGLAELQTALGLSEPPAAVEAYDISNISGVHAVGSMVVFLHGRPTRKSYRRFKIRLGTKGEPNDFAMMREVISRRLSHGTGDPKFAALPDLILVDGGKPQLRAAKEAIEAASAGRIAVAALAKKKEELFMPGQDEPVLLPERSQGLYLIQRIRDEAHRFALDYHQRLRAQTMRGSGLDKLPGIGPKRRQLLLKKFGSLKKVKAAGEQELIAAGLSPSLAKTLKELLT